MCRTNDEESDIIGYWKAAESPRWGLVTKFIHEVTRPECADDEFDWEVLPD